ncbi:MAG: large conductance mechanosensitive channel protein MscL [Eubacteriales bacterium]|nr:large conductance mechanosensitive channel protein MscL [Eubacteriales bacterium]
MKKFFTEFKEFAMKGNVLDMAIGVMVGAAFGKIVSSLVNDILMPLIGIILGGINLKGAFYALDGKTYASIDAAKAAGVGTLNYGIFVQTIIDFVIIAFCIFSVMKVVNKLFEKPKPVEKEPRKCEYCFQIIPEEATRCPYCTSELHKQE